VTITGASGAGKTEALRRLAQALCKNILNGQGIGHARGLARYVTVAIETLAAQEEVDGKASTALWRGAQAILLACETVQLCENRLQVRDGQHTYSLHNARSIRGACLEYHRDGRCAQAVGHGGLDPHRRREAEGAEL